MRGMRFRLIAIALLATVACKSRRSPPPDPSEYRVDAGEARRYGVDFIILRGESRPLIEAFVESEARL